jgi:CRISPR-associated endonuclease/helicase Cas3
LKLQELLPKDQATGVFAAERRRIRYFRAGDGNVLSVEKLIELISVAKGPRLIILNTVQNAAVVAKAMRESGSTVLHLSTALTPRDRDRVLAKVERWLQGRRKSWSLVATSCVEAGVDLSFRCAFRERFAAASTIQTGGRVNRDSEYEDVGGGIVYDFALEGDGITQHPAADVSSNVLLDLMAKGELDSGNPSDIVTKAMRRELSERGGLGSDFLVKAEAARDYPKVKELGRVIEADTRLVIVDHHLQNRLIKRGPVSFRTLLRGSVQLWATKIEKLGLEPLPGRRDLYVWNNAYDPDFLGYMEGVLRTRAFIAEGGAII